MSNYGPTLALAVPIPKGVTELTPGQWKQGMKARLRQMQKQYPQNLLEDEWEQRTGEILILKDWGSLMDSLELQTRLMESGHWLEGPIKIDANEMIEDSEMLTDPIDLLAYMT